MTRIFRHGATVAAAALFTAGSAHADVTPQDVWTQWEAYLASFGYEVTQQPVAEDADLHLPDFSMAIPVPADPATGGQSGTVTITMGEIALIDRGDGTVSVELPASMPLSITGDGVDATPVEVTGTITSSGYSTIASGTPDDITYTFAADSFGVSIDQLTGPKGQPIRPAAMEFVMQGAEGTSRVATSGDGTTIGQTFTLSNLTYDVDITVEEEGKPGQIKASGGFSDMASTTTGMIPASFNPAAMADALAAGYAINAEMIFQSGQSSLNFAEPDQSFEYASTSEGGSFTLSLGTGGLAYDIASTGINFSLASSDIPFPISSSLGAFGLGIGLPVVKGEAEQDFSARLTLTDLVVPDPLWMMIDAGGALPHDPLTAEIETSGKARLFVDLLDETATRELARGGTQPGEVTQLTLDKLLLKAGGATIAATGGFDIDNSAKSMINPDLPAFAGQVDLRLTGVTTLLGKLGQMGLIPMPQVMIASGMIQQLGQPGNGPDDFSALIEVTKDSQVRVNGAPMPLK